MIYSHAILSNINDYKPFINRALYPCYIENEKLFLNYHVTEEKDIQGVYLGQFIYQYSILTKLLFPKVRVDSKVNVQSEGNIELITHSVNSGLIILAIISGVIIITTGGKFKFMGLELDVQGLINTIQTYKSKRLDNDSKRLDNDSKRLSNTAKELENMKKMKEISDEIGVPMSELGIRLPKKLKSALEKFQVPKNPDSNDDKKKPND